jgi:hypothetical protein
MVRSSRWEMKFSERINQELLGLQNSGASHDRDNRLRVILGCRAAEATQRI